jgi:hypothetical protein
MELDADNPRHLLTDPAGGYRLAASELGDASDGPKT